MRQKYGIDLSDAILPNSIEAWMIGWNNKASRRALAKMPNQLARRIKKRAAAIIASPSAFAKSCRPFSIAAGPVRRA
jgi:hypothetical protein